MHDKRFCYFDNNATTQVAPEVVEAMLPVLTEHWGNPSSAYEFGTRVAELIEGARTKAAALINAEPREVVFTSCGTESNNTALSSALRLSPHKRHVITTAVEHSANIKFGRHLIQQGYDVTFLPVESDGSIDIHLLEQALKPETAIVSAMFANNETGVIFPIEEMAAICRYKGVPFHTDAVQTPGKLKLDVKALDIDFLSLSGHKLHAPKGIGLLYVRSGSRLQPYIIGGGQERGRRGGTENVPYMVGFGRAAELAMNSIADENIRVRALRDRLEDTILKTIPGAARNGSRVDRLCNTSNISFPNVEAEAVLKKLDQIGVCASSGSACTTGSLDPSHVLMAMGMSPARALGSVRFSLGIYNTDTDVDHLLAHLPRIITELQAETP
ncbi:MAG TPA: cysteine desulfurase NifS [Verrucomicrobiales bacterium]|nr:cysteine desulfurase NifS [Verrucomicrobiales bacterium]